MAVIKQAIVVSKQKYTLHKQSNFQLNRKKGEL